MPVEIQNNLPLFFFDNALIASQKKLVRRWQSATISPKPVLEPDKPWEGRILGLFGTVLKDPQDGYRMYYSSINFLKQESIFKTSLALAASSDGLSWYKPELGIVGYRESKNNNIVISSDNLYFDSASFMHDPVDSEFPYKAIIYQAIRPSLLTPWADWPERGLYSYMSSDGLNWVQYPKPRLIAGDMTNLMASRQEGKFIIYTRDHDDMMEKTGGRAIYRSESCDFLNWSKPEIVFAPDLTDEPDVEFYGMSVFERHGWYLGLLQYWRSDIDVIEIHLAFSSNGRDWKRPVQREPFISAKHDWNSKWSTCASNGPIILAEQMVFYFGGRAVAHGFDTAQQYGAIGYASLPLDRFCALEALYGGQAVTVPIKWPGGDLAINADTRESFVSHPRKLTGEIRVDILDAEGRPIPQWSGENGALFQENTHCRCTIYNQIVRWSGDRSMDMLKGNVIRLCFNMKHARLYTFEARRQD